MQYVPPFRNLQTAIKQLTLEKTRKLQKQVVRRMKRERKDIPSQRFRT